MDDNETQKTAAAPTLYLLPVPLSDVAPELVMPAANIKVARRVRHFIVENVRSARRFLKRCDRSIDIDSLTFSELNEHTDPLEVASMLEPLGRGEDMAVVSEAGCPAVADPGALAVAEAHRRGYRVRPLVGPSSILLSLMGSGFNGQTWAFAGYLPHESAARASMLKEMQRRIERERQTQIFIETPYRNNKLIAELCQRLPSHMLLCVASDVTGPGESILTRPLSAWKRARYDYDKTPTIFLLYS
ncbi:MAG: SAM-dependent methyltransferase [Bacteroides sp.]|nr:SAM-dependent methyltransferase [Bacteroides sp.]MCM1412991.1 SAM-dependent methyltransferase [Bacteroides sp.]MCM1471697.1 SAM-dependent methyltransferase [Bacteroides sp.]